MINGLKGDVPMVGYRRARHVLDLITTFIPNAYGDLPKSLLSKQTRQGGHDVICPLQLLVRGESAENNDALICCGDSRSHEERFLLDVCVGREINE